MSSLTKRPRMSLEQGEGSGTLNLEQRPNLNRSPKLLPKSKNLLFYFFKQKKEWPIERYMLVNKSTFYIFRNYLYNLECSISYSAIQLNSLTFDLQKVQKVCGILRFVRPKNFALILNEHYHERKDMYCPIELALEDLRPYLEEVKKLSIHHMTYTIILQQLFRQLHELTCTEDILNQDICISEMTLDSLTLVPSTSCRALFNCPFSKIFQHKIRHLDISGFKPDAYYYKRLSSDDTIERSLESLKLGWLFTQSDIISEPTNFGEITNRLGDRLVEFIRNFNANMPNFKSLEISIENPFKERPIEQEEVVRRFHQVKELCYNFKMHCEQFSFNRLVFNIKDRSYFLSHEPTSFWTQTLRHAFEVQGEIQVNEREVMYEFQKMDGILEMNFSMEIYKEFDEERHGFKSLELGI